MNSQHKPAKLPAADMASVHLCQRREVRYVVPLEIEVSGVARDGRVFRQRVLTRDVSEWGCGFLSPLELRIDDIIALRLLSHVDGKPAETQQALFQVVRSTRERDGWSVGAWKLELEDVWGVDLARIGTPLGGSLESGGPSTSSGRVSADQNEDW